MSTKKVLMLTQETVADASKAELLAFGNSECGFEFTGDESRDYLIELICESQGWARKDPSEEATHVVVRLGKEEGALGSLGYRGGFNGRMFTIPREKDVEIPIEFYNTIVDTNQRGFTLEPNVKDVKEGSPVGRGTIQVSGVPLSVLRFLKKA